MSSIRSQRSQQGFTLIELSIVLVIIGLLVGGVLVGQDMIKAAGVRSTLAQLEKIDTGVNTFRDKYNCLPGDCNKATQVFGANFASGSNGVGPVTNGNGDGLITATSTVTDGVADYATVTGASENLQFFPQLAAAKLFEGTYTSSLTGQNLAATPVGNFPQAKAAATGIMPMYFANKNWYHIGVNDVSTGTVNTNNALSGYQAGEMDRKADDGRPETGKMTAFATGTMPPVTYNQWGDCWGNICQGSPLDGNGNSTDNGAGDSNCWNQQNPQSGCYYNTYYGAITQDGSASPDITYAGGIGSTYPSSDAPSVQVRMRAGF